jgi:hypothetical protein
MTSYEERHRERQWKNRLEQERREISASVEEALSRKSEIAWSEEEGEGEWNEQGKRQMSGKSATLIPPRLSLQSKELPALRPGGFVASATAAHAAFQHTSANAQSEAARKKVAEESLPGQTNIFVRVAQRLTTSFAALRPEPESGQESSHIVRALPLLEEEYMSDSRVVMRVSPPLAPADAPAPLVRKVIDAIPATPSTRPVVAIQQVVPQRLAGYTTKIRLQAASRAIVTSLLPKEHEEMVEGVGKSVTNETQQAISRRNSGELYEAQLVLVQERDVSEVTTQPDLPTVSHMSESLVTAIEKEREEAFQVMVFGNALFESGQGEVLVAHEEVRGSSVVYVTLTSNPGQTLVQYVSLHPHIGFTVHLTAPVTMRTTFNYVFFGPKM